MVWIFSNSRSVRSAISWWFLQYICDNADFNIRTIDGHGTFHSMGGIQRSTPASNSGSVGATKRVLTPPKASVIGSYAEVPIKPYTQPPSKALSKLTIKDPIEHEVATTVAELLDVLWISGHTIQATPRPSWAWFMQSAMQNIGNLWCQWDHNITIHQHRSLRL